ncbi:MAG TPA: AAA family ATPase [Steroidobacteraceae bacterium]|jgi:type II secretory pathway predicted ATPase ExeA|nr:AAA family ATPase [Steroidobacteraceae bacterium]
MYTELFKIRDLPFRLSPDPQFLYLSKNHARAKAYMESTIWFTDGFVVITGEIGSGKTTLIETFLSELEKDVVVAQINQTQVSAIEFLQALLVQFGFTPFKMKKAELIATLNSFLIEQYSAGRKVLLIVDEAQNLSLRVLEEIRMLSGVETTKEKVLRIILAGQPELNAKLDSPELTQLAQRVRLRFHLTALSESDSQSYVLHRLEVAGSGGRKIFQDQVFPMLYRYTGGVPRLVNTLCETAMMSAFNQDRDFVTAADVQAALDELQWVEFAERRAAAARSVAMHDPTSTGNLGNEHAVVRHGNSAGPQLYVGAPSEDTGTRHSMEDEVLAKIIVACDGHTIGELPLRAGRTVVGRTADNDLQIDSRFVSRHHCQIVISRNSCVIEDLNSTNGIVIKSKRVRHHNLNDGDVVIIGKHELMFVDERTPSSRWAQLDHAAAREKD